MVDSCDYDEYRTPVDEMIEMIDEQLAFLEVKYPTRRGPRKIPKCSQENKVI